MKSIWKGMSVTQRVVCLAVCSAAAAGLVIAARRDLSGRDAAAVRGDRAVWKRITYLPGAAAAYLAFGRRKYGAETHTPAPALQR